MGVPFLSLTDSGPSSPGVNAPREMCVSWPSRLTQASEHGNLTCNTTWKLCEGTLLGNLLVMLYERTFKYLTMFGTFPYGLALGMGTILYVLYVMCILKT